MGSTDPRSEISQLAFDGNAQAPNKGSWWLTTSWFSEDADASSSQANSVGGAICQNRFSGKTAIPSFQLEQQQQQQQKFDKFSSQNARKTGEGIDATLSDQTGSWEFDFDTWSWVWKVANQEGVRIAPEPYQNVEFPSNKRIATNQGEYVSVSDLGSSSINVSNDFVEIPVQIQQTQKRQLWESVVLPLRSPQLYSQLGIQVGCPGVLLTGPTGSGKSTLVKQALKEHDLSVEFAFNANEILGAFDRAQRKIRPCLVVLDCVFDSVGNKTLLAEAAQYLIQGMDNIQKAQEGKVSVVVITNTPVDVPERVRNRLSSRGITLGSLSIHERETLLTGLLSSVAVNQNLDIQQLAQNMPGAVAGDVVGMVRNALTKCLSQIVEEHGKGVRVDPADIVLCNEHFHFGNQGGPSAMRELRVESPNVSWDEIGGLEGAKQELQEFCKFNLEYKQEMEILGLKPGRGVLLYGPPGCGKTMMGKALASQSKANFISVQGPELLNRWFGESERAIREVFQTARQCAPCVLFLDEIDSIGSRQEATAARVLTTLLCELDGIGRHNRDLLVIGATNRPEMLDGALMRPGRFDSVVRVGLPDFDDRKQIIQQLLSKRPCGDEIVSEEFVGELAERSEGCSGADLRGYVDDVCMDVLRKEVSLGKSLLVRKEHFQGRELRKSVGAEVNDRYLQIEEQLKHGMLFGSEATINGQVAGAATSMQSTVEKIVENFKKNHDSQLVQQLEKASMIIKQQQKQIVELQDKLGVIPC
eukprot:TRINITY_DN2272_c0_g1_i3.p1 TRINITY_DN2272_c0_g1~~TRINITY_DN2272_c0_g1_i3.p1  ORF type:complete len:793 (-),score=131.17 TRINITY_DN2272_c0_g1_i3:659-2929(-)